MSLHRQIPTKWGDIVGVYAPDSEPQLQIAVYDSDTDRTANAKLDRDEAEALHDAIGEALAVARGDTEPAVVS